MSRETRLTPLTNPSFPVYDTYAPVPRVPGPTRLDQIEIAVQRALRREIPITDDVGWGTVAKSIVASLIDAGLIGLPTGDAARTSVRCDYVSELGALLSCRKGDDADDVLKTAIRASRK